MSYDYCNIHRSGSESLLLSMVRIPNSFYHKAKGLLGERETKHTNMLFKKCNNIHMIGMKIPLDILFLSNEGVIVKSIPNLQPWRVAICFKATMTLELASGSIKKMGLKQNMKLEIKECN